MMTRHPDLGDPDVAAMHAHLYENVGRPEAAAEVEPIEQLNEALKEAEDELHALGFGVSASVMLDEGAGTLIWRKEGGDWLLLVQPINDTSQHALLKASKRFRLLAARKLGALLEALRVEYAKQYDETIAAVSMTQDFVRHCRRTKRANGAPRTTSATAPEDK
jgi:hypothetical protein